MRKILGLLLIVLVSVVIFLPPKILAQEPTQKPNSCLADDVTIDPNNNFNVTLRLEETKDPTLRFKIFLEKKSIEGLVINGIVTFELGRMPPGDYPFIYFINNYPVPLRCTRDRGEKRIRIPDVGQGGTTKVIEGTLEITPPNPTSDETISFIVKNLAKDSIYTFHIVNSEFSNIAETICVTSANKQVELVYGPFSGGTWRINVSEKDPKSGNICRISSNRIARGEFTISALGDTPPSLPLTPIPTASLPPCAQWVYSYADPEGRCKNKASIKDLDPNNPENNCRLNDLPIPTGYQEYVDPDFKDRKCAEVSTGLGPISTDPFGFVKSILSILLSLAGGIAVILIIISGYRLMTSQGNPEAVQGARDQLTSAIVGFLFIIFSLVILQVVGVDILHIPGFE